MKSVSLSLLLWVLALMLSACSSPRTLPALMVERLDWMDEVAMAKRARSLPVTDPVREAELLRRMTQRGVAAGLKPVSVQRFFTGQMLAAKEVQEECLRQHPQGLTSYMMVPDLTLTVRPALDEIGQQMIAELALPRSPAESAAILTEAQQRLARAGYSEAVMQPALDGLQAGLAP
jgi:chorismate mutase-like protein